MIGLEDQNEQFIFLLKEDIKEGCKLMIEMRYYQNDFKHKIEPTNYLLFEKQKVSEKIDFKQWVNEKEEEENEKEETDKEGNSSEDSDWEETERNLECKSEFFSSVGVDRSDNTAKKSEYFFNYTIFRSTFFYN